MRRLLTAGAAVTLAVLGLVSPARAGVGYSEWCTQPWLPGTDGSYTELVNDPTLGYAGARYGTSNPDDFAVNVCYSDRQLGTPSAATGGMVHLRYYKSGPNTYNVYTHCYGESGWLAMANCKHDVTTTITTHTAPGVGGSAAGAVYANGSTLFVAPTGAATGSATPDFDSTPGVTYGGTCATVLGTTPPGATCTTAAVDADVATSDVTGLFLGTTSTCLVDVLGFCWLYMPTAGVVLFGDPSTSTTVSVLGSTPIPVDPGRQCVGYPC